MEGEGLVFSEGSGGDSNRYVWEIEALCGFGEFELTGRSEVFEEDCSYSDPRANAEQMVEQRSCKGGNILD